MGKIFVNMAIIVVVVITIGGVIAGIRDLEQQKKSHHKSFGIYEKYFKRLSDFILAAGALILFSPVMLVTAFLVRINLGKPVIFQQERPGKDEKIFTLFKYRSMSDKKDENGKLLKDEERLTDFGKSLRSTSLDELPELWNILKGDMSIVGPRPLRVEYLPLYDEKQKHRHDVRPGLTGYAQISGRNGISWEERFQDDLEYVNNIRFLNDVKIILKTVIVVFNHSGISSETSVTMEAFKGNLEDVR